MRMAIFIFLSSTHQTHQHIKPPSAHPPCLHPPKDQTFTHGFSFENGYFQCRQRKHQHQHHGIAATTEAASLFSSPFSSTPSRYENQLRRLTVTAAAFFGCCRIAATTPVSTASTRG
ncbi:unnamed protein product, partial [Vitis vinifera]|uniref:Uncharacterized protein n=1 Tax=Vitis vinifera TaxID=29760 RepID=D7TUD8_VITVI